MAPEPPSSKIEPSKVSISSQEAPVKIYDYVLVSKIKFSTRTLRGVAAQKYALQFNFILKNWTAKSPGDFRKIVRLRGLFGKFGVDGVPVDYWKVQGVSHKIDGL